MEGLNLDIIKHLKLKKAPISEQNKFEAIYHSIKAKEYIVKNSTHLLTELYNSLMQQAFTGRLKLDVAVELDALLKVLDLRKSSNDIISIATNEEYLLNLVSRLNSQNFDNQELYDKAKHAAYQLLKEDENLVQKYDRSTKSIKLFLR